MSIRDSIESSWRRLATLVISVSVSLSGQSVAQVDPVTPFLPGLASADIATRQSAFYGLLNLGSTGVPTSTTDAIPYQISAIVAGYPTDVANITSELNALLNTENANVFQNSAFSASIQNESFGDYYADVIEIRSEASDPQARYLAFLGQLQPAAW